MRAAALRALLVAAAGAVALAQTAPAEREGAAQPTPEAGPAAAPATEAPAEQGGAEQAPSATATAPGEPASAGGAAAAGEEGGGPAPGEPAPAAGPTPAEGAARAASPAARELLRATLADDLAGAGYDELRAEARRLGLDDAGSRSDLQERLRRFHGLPAAPPAEAAAAAQEVAVRQAAHAEYRTAEATGARYLVLRGGVELAVRETEEETEHLIRADEVIYQQEAELLSARGGVEYQVSAAGGEPQTVNAASMAFDLDASKVVFVDGATRHRREGAAGPVTFSFAGDTITRLGDGTIILDGARVTSSPDPSVPNYELRAQRMWLLAPGEWALQGATLYVGAVPVLYLPFLFLPGDEMVFHPALGVRDREGLFLNTTLYLIGRRPPDEEPLSVLSLADPGSYREEVRGLFLRKMEADEAPNDEHYLKLMLDAYARLGLFTGVAGVLPVAEAGVVEFQAGVARSRSIWDADGRYTATDPLTGLSWWHDSSLFGVTLPLRYGVELATNLQLPAGALRARLELFSDPEFSRDFDNREERFNWTELIGFGGAEDEEPPASRSNLVWELDANADLTPLLAAEGSGPSLIDQLLLRNAGLLWQWQSREAPAAGASQGARDDPTRDFFYPSTLRLPLLVELGGTLWQRPAAAGPAAEGEAEPDLPAELRPRSGAEAPGSEEPQPPPPARGPALREPEHLPRRPSALPARPADEARLRYELRPGATIEGTHDSDEWKTAADVDYALRDATVQLTNTALLQHDAELFGGVLGLDHSLRHNVVTQHPLHAADSLSEKDRKKLFEQARDEFASTVSVGNRLTLRPLRGVPAWAGSALTYDLDLRLLRTTAPADDRLRNEWGSWDADGVTRHRLQAVSEVRVADQPQRLTLSAALPPRPHALDASLALAAGSLSATADTGFRCRDDDEATLAECSDWKLQPINLSFRAKPLEPLSLQQQFSIDPEPEARVTRSVSTLGLGGLSAALIADRVKAEGRTDEPIGLHQLRLRYDETLGPAYLWRNRVKLELTTGAGWTISFRKPRENRFTFTTALTAGVHEFLDLTLSTSSSNDRTYRYFPEWTRAEEATTLNPLEDLLWSFAFWDDDLRRRSNFKIEQVSLEAVHHLQDWDLTVAYTASPKSDTGDLTSEFSIVVQWLPVPEFRSRLSAEDEEFSISE